VDRARLLDTIATEALVSARTILRRWPDSEETAVRLGRLLAQGRPSTYPLFADTGFMRRRLAEQLAWRGHLHEAYRVLGGRQVPLFAELAVLGAIPADSAAATFERWSREDPAGVGAALSWWSDRRNAAAISAYYREALRRAASGSEQGDRSEAAYDVEAATAYRLLATGDSVQALRAFRRLPDTLCTACYLDRLVRARLLIRSGSYVEAYRDLSEPLDAFLTPMEIVFALERGRLAERLGERREAERAYRLVSEAWAHGDHAALSLVSEARSGLERVGRPRGLAVRTSD
jgi:hypothetical protein